MEYSLQNLNKISNLKNLTLTNFIEKLNLIGLEIDNVSEEKDKLKKDIWLTIKIPANRDDLLNQILVAEEFSQIFLFEIYYIWKKLKKKYFFLLKQNYLHFSEYKTIEIKSNLKYFLTYAISIEKYEKNIKPTWISNRLNLEENNQKNSLQLLVDLILLEAGQNFNTFCNQTQNTFIVEQLPKNTTLFFNKKSYQINKGTILLKDDNNEIVSILGIINHIEEKENILIQASFYDINENLLFLNDINSEISYRSLRRNFLQIFKFSFQRLLTLCEIILAAKINSNIYKTTTENFELNTYKLLKIDKNSFKKFLNIDSYQIKIFEESGLKIVCSTLNQIYLKIPEFRKDLTREIDIIEEYARFIGYSNFQEVFPEIINTQKLKSTNKKEFLKQFFITHNFNEIFSNSLISETKIVNNSIVLKNPLNTDFSILRSSLAKNLLDVFLNNLRLKTNYLKFFEIGRVYRKKFNSFIEEEYLSFILPIESNSDLPNSKIDWFKAKGFVEHFLAYFNKKNFSFQKLTSVNLEYHPKKTIQILENNKVIGIFGEINPKIKKLHSLKQNTFLFEFNLNSITDENLKSNIKTYKEYSKYPLIIKDLSILVSKDINFFELKKFILAQIQNVKNVNFFDVYFGVELKEKISLSIRLEFQSFDKTLLTDEIEIELKKLISLLNTNFKVELKL